MQTIAILSQKGGTGKTTLTLHLAVAAERDGRTAAVIDLDPQASAAGWSDARKTDSPAVVPVPSARLAHALEAAKANGASIVFIETAPQPRDAPHGRGAAPASAEAADLVLIPCRPGILDLRAIGMTARAVKLAGKPAYVVLNAMPSRAPNVLADARAAVAVHHLDVAPVVMQQRAAYAHALIGGQTAQEYEPSGKATEEIGRLYEWVKEELSRMPAKVPAMRQAGKTASRKAAV